MSERPWPSQIGPYQVTGLLGQGAMSRVYRAKLALLGDQEYAIKLLRERCKPREVSGFLGECAKVKRLGTHPHIVPLYFAGRDRRLARYYVVMELVQGQTAAQLLNSSPAHQLPLEQALHIGVQVALALEHAHQRGILHLDVKPSNILVQEEGVLAKLTDFGSARLREEDPALFAVVRPAAPAYRAWEQTPVGGHAGVYPDERSDVYGLAATLYHLLTGHAPRSDEAGQVIPPTRWRAGLPITLEALLLRALSQEAQWRPATMHEFRRGLEQVLAPQRIHRVAPPPTLATSLIGRETLLETLKQRLLADENLALSALNGLPGVGKTALAAAIVNDPEIQTHFADGILWGGLGPQPDLRALLSAWGAALGMHPITMTSLTSLDAWSMALRNVIDQRRLLLVIDDAWTPEAALACQVGGPHCVHLLTTRSTEVALHFAGTGTIRVPELDEAAGERLLAQLAPDAVAAEPVAATQLVQAAGGLPLALVLIGKYLHTEAYHRQPRRLQAALEHLQQTAERLCLERPLTPGDHAPGLPPGASLSLAASIEISYRALSRSTRSLLRTLSVFPAKPNTFSEEAVLAVADCSPKILDRLTGAGLLETSGPGRYALHQTIADFARVKQGKGLATSRLVAYSIAFLERHQRDYATLDLEQLNMQAAFDAAYEQQMYTSLIQGITIWWPYLHARGLFDLAEHQLLRALEATKAGADGPGRVLILLQLGQTVEKRGDYTRAVACFEEALEVARQQDLPKHLGALLHALGWIAEKRGAYHEAAAYLEEGLEIARQRADQEQLVPLLSSLGVVAHKRGNPVLAEQYYQEGLRVARQLHLQERIVSLLDNLGSLYYVRGEMEQAEAHYREALELARQLGYRDRIASLLNNLGGLVTIRGAFAEAEAYLQEGLSLAQHLGHRERMAFLLNSLGESISEQGDAVRAASYFREGLALARQIGYREILAVLLTNLGTALWKAGEGDAAIWLQESQAIAEELGHAHLRTLNLNAWGELHLQHAHPDLAATAFHTAQQLAREAQVPLELASACYGLARAAEALGDVASARQQALESVTLFKQLGDFRAGVVQRWLDQLPVMELAPRLEETG